MIARNSSFTYKGRSIDIRSVGRELGVQSVLEGSIRRSGDRVRITAQLVDTTNGAHLWADRYDRDLTDIFEVQDDVTHRIVDALKITLSPAEKQRLADTETANIAAYDCVLRGREFMLAKERTRETFAQAIKYFKEALHQALKLMSGGHHRNPRLQSGFICMPNLRSLVTQARAQLASS